ncbi:MAG: YcgL domain-containing protein [Pseudomonadota bacterium]|nr:YcgL domain-containing protein [Pseudomonadota bacterium]
MHCDIYKASTRDELYVYIARPDYPDDADGFQDPFAKLPSDLRKALGRPSFVMHLDLSERQRLARVDIQQVLSAFDELGYFVQFPPDGLISPTAMAPEGLRGA